MERNINRTVIALAVLVGIVTGMTLQQSVLARRAYGSYDLDEDSRQAILHGGSGGSNTRTRSRSTETRRTRVHQSSRQPVQAIINSPNTPSVPPSNYVQPEPTVSRTVSFDTKPGGLSPLTPIDPPTSYVRP